MRTSQTGKDELSRLSQNRTLACKNNRAIGSFHNQVGCFGFLGRNDASDFSHNPCHFDAALGYYCPEQNAVKKMKQSSENKRFWRANPSKRESPRESEKFNFALKGRISRRAYTKI